MKTLYVLRHAKSGFGDPGLDDRERTLAPRGRRACETLGKLFATLPPPELAWVSAALRTRETFDRTAEAWTHPPTLEVRDALYLASASQWIDTLAETDPEISRVLLVGHNPGLHQLVFDLARDDGSDPRQRVAENFPTGAFAVLEFDQDSWALRTGRGTLTTLEWPRRLAPEPG